MNLKHTLQTPCAKEIKDISNNTLGDLMAYMYKCKSFSFYVTDNEVPIYIFTNTDFLEIFRKKAFNVKIIDYINKFPKTVKKLNINTNVLDAYYFLRSNKINQLPVVNDEDKLVGEISFELLGLKIADLVIKDPLTGLFNQKYFEVLLEEYNEFEKPMGLIYIELKNINILEAFYGSDIIENVIKTYAHAIKQSLRDIDFVFRMGYRFKVITFNNLEITDKIVNRIKNKLANTEYNGVKSAFSITFSHVPELEDSVLTAIESCEKKLLE